MPLRRLATGRFPARGRTGAAAPVAIRGWTMRLGGCGWAVAFRGGASDRCADGGSRLDGVWLGGSQSEGGQ